MTTTAHTVRKLYGGATRQPMPRQREHSLTAKDIQPWLYKKPKSRRRKPYAPLIKQWLMDHGPATASQIGKGLNINKDVINASLKRGIDGVGIVGQFLPEKGAPVRTWGVVEE
jgi:hypothetical protein